MNEKEKIEEMAREMLKISTSANVEPVLEIDGKEITLGENATKILDNILEQAFIPYLAENLYEQGYRKESDVVAEVLSLGNELLKELTENTELSILEKKATQAGVQLLITKIEKKYKGAE